MRSPSPIRAVALFEAAKGALVLAAGLGALSLIHHDVQHMAEQLLSHQHLNPAKPYPRIFIDAAVRLTDARLWLLAGLAALYALVVAVMIQSLRRNVHARMDATGRATQLVGMRSSIRSNSSCQSGGEMPKR